MHAGGEERVVATIKREGRFASAGAMLRRRMNEDKQHYYVDVQPGMDAAFVVALVMVADEMDHDGEDSD